MKTIHYILVWLLLSVASCSNVQRITMKHVGRVSKTTPEKILKVANDMDLPQLYVFYKDNQYSFLRDAIINKVSSNEYSLDDLKKAAILFSFDAQINNTLQKKIEKKQVAILEKASEMDLPQLAEFYKENQYDFLRDAISECVSSLDGSIEDLQNAANIFSFDEGIQKVLQKRVEVKEEQQRKWYATIYYQTCDSLLTDLEYLASCELAEYIGELVSTTLVDNIFENELPEKKYQIDKKANNWVQNLSNKANDKILELFAQFVDEEKIKRRDFVAQNNMPYSAGTEINIHNIANNAIINIPHKNSTYPELYIISKRQNSRDWVGWGLTAAEFATGFIPGAQLISAGITIFNTGRDISNLNETRKEMIRYGQKISEKIFNELQEESNNRIQYISNSIINNIKTNLGL